MSYKPSACSCVRRAGAPDIAQPSPAGEMCGKQARQAEYEELVAMAKPEAI